MKNPKVLIVEDRQKWDEFIQTWSSFALLQSWKWGEFKQEMGWKVFRMAVEENGTFIAAAQMLVKPLPGKLASIAYIPRGPMTDWQEEETTALLLEALHRAARKEHAISLMIEPPILATCANDALLNKFGFRHSRVTNQPRNTIVVDIQPGPEELLSQMHHKTRQYIRRASKEGITSRQGDESDLNSFIQLMESTGKRAGFPVRSRRYYELEHKAFSPENQLCLLLAEKDGNLLAARTIYAFGRYAAEFHAGSICMTENMHPNYLLVWEGIQWAKAKGCISYDMWGIPDEIRFGEGNEPAVGDENLAQLERRDGLWGVYRFKRGFSRNIVTYAGAYDYVYLSIPYLLYGNRLLNRNTVEKIAIWMESLRKNRRR